MKKDLNRKNGFLLYADTLDAAFELLPQMPQRGELFTNVYNFVTGKELKFSESDTRAAFIFLKKGILTSNEKYAKEVERRAEYYKKKNQNTKNAQNTDNAQNSENTVSHKSTDTNSDTNSDTRSIGDNTHLNNLNNNSLNINNSFSIKNSYTKKEIQELLEREKIFLKKSEFDKFYTLNQETYKWKLDPKSAVWAYIERHPASLSPTKKTELPPAAPQPRKIISGLPERAADTWNRVKSAIKDKISDFDFHFFSKSTGAEFNRQSGIIKVFCYDFIREVIEKPEISEQLKQTLTQQGITEIRFDTILLRAKDTVKAEQDARQFWDIMLYDLKNYLTDSDKEFLKQFVYPVTYVDEILKIRITDASLKDTFKNLKVIYKYFQEQKILLGLIF